MPKGVEALEGGCLHTTDVRTNPIFIHGFDYNYDYDYAVSVYNPESKTLSFIWNGNYEITKQVLSD